MIDTSKDPHIRCRLLRRMRGWEKYYKFLNILVSNYKCFTFNSLNDIFIGCKKTCFWLGQQNPLLGQQKDHTPTCNELISTESYFTQITSQPKFQIANQLSPIILTSVACALGPSVIMSSTGFSFRNLVFGEFI